MIDSNNLKDKKNDLKFFYNNTLFKDLETKHKITGIKRLATFIEKSLNGSVMSVNSSRNSYRNKLHRGNSIVHDRHKLVKLF
jgi:hypothetical protein